MIIARPRPQILTIWRLILTIGSAVPAFAISFFLKGVAYKFAAVVWFLIFLGAYLFYLPTLYNSLVYIVEQNNVTVRRGVFYNNVYSIPMSAVQFTTITISPFSRLFGLVTLKVVSAGAKVSMPGMTLKEARTFEKAFANKGEPRE